MTAAWSETTEYLLGDQVTSGGHTYEWGSADQSLGIMPDGGSWVQVDPAPTGAIAGAGITVSIGMIGQGAPWVGGASSFTGVTTVSLPGPFVVAADAVITGPPLVYLFGDPVSGVDVNVMLVVTNAAGTEQIMVGGTLGTTDADTGAGHGYAFAGNPAVAVATQVGTDLTYDEETGTVSTTAGGVFFVTALATVSND